VSRFKRFLRHRRLGPLSVIGWVASAFLSSFFSSWISASPLAPKFHPGPAGPVTVQLPANFGTKPSEPPEPLNDLPITLHELECRGDDAGSVDGGRATLKLAVFSDEYSWDFKSDHRVLLNGRPVDLLGILREPGFGTLINADEVIAVGTASCEGDPIVEGCRALHRARQLKAWLRRTRTRGGSMVDARPLHVLNLGQYRGACSPGHPGQTEAQRRVMLVAVDRTAGTVSLERCLRQAFDHFSSLRYVTLRYADFTLDPDPDDDPCLRVAAEAAP